MSSKNWRYLNLALSHGISLAVTIYLTVQGGLWLDRRFGTSPLFLMILVLLGIAASFRLLIKDILREEDNRRKLRREEEGKGDKDSDGHD